MTEESLNEKSDAAAELETETDEDTWKDPEEKP